MSDMMMRRGSNMMPRRDRRGMGPDYRNYGDGEYSSQYGDSTSSRYDNARVRRDYERGGQHTRDYNYDMRMRDGHHLMRQGVSTYYPIEAMGTFNGYYGMPEDYEDMRGRRDYGYDYDSGMLEDEDIEHWTEKLKHEVEEKDKQFFTKENIKKKAMEMGIKFDKFSLEEFMVTTLMVYTDYCKTLGTANMETYLRLAKDWLCDEDAGIKYGEKLAAYYDYIVEG